MYTKIKGTYDVLPEKAKQLSSLEAYLKNVVSLYGFEEIRTPILESTELIHRSSGHDSDIVKKETYDFKDRGDRNITLRPEGTSSVIRAVIENKLYTRLLPLKLFYLFDNFRYERPQKGRYREFRQFGVEVIGSNSPYMDGEVIALVSTIIDSLRISDYTIRINSIGDDASRKNYTKALKEYFSKDLNTLCEDCKKRYESNPLRILDCKIDGASDLFKSAPIITDYLSADSKAKFDVVKAYLDTLGIKYTVDPRLVRGLDYYSETVFEFETNTDTLGQAKTICGGGRYDKLVKELDGPDLKCLGFAFGMERLVEILNRDDYDYSKHNMVQFIPIGLDAKAHLVSLMQDARLTGFTCEMDYEAKNLKAHFKSAENNKARFIVIVGDEELEKKTVKIKDKELDKEEEVQEENLKSYMLKAYKCAKEDCSNCGGCE